MKHFTEKELSCKHCGKMGMDETTLKNLITMREDLDFPLPITSGYRCPEHNKAVGGHPNSAHMLGHAIDIQISGENAATLVAVCISYGFNGIGVKQHGEHSGRYIHLDDNHVKRTIWSYK